MDEACIQIDVGSKMLRMCVEVVPGPLINWTELLSFNLSGGEKWNQLMQLRQAREEIHEKDLSSTSSQGKGVLPGSGKSSAVVNSSLCLRTLLWY